MAGSTLFDAMIYLAAAVICVPLAKRIGLGSVLGYLLAGILIGPFLLGFIGEEGEDLLHFAEFGVVMMLFLVGLELEPRLLWRLRVPVLGMGGVQVLATTLVLGGLAWGALGMSWQQGLAIGMTLALSSTAIVLQTLAERGLLGTAGGQSSFSVLLFQDIAVIAMLAVVPLLATGAGADAGGGDGHHGEGGGLLAELPGWVRTLATLASVAVVVLGGRYLVPPVLRIVARARQRELLTGVALLLVVSVAVLMGLVGLSPALGTFLGGVALANSNYKHELESDLEPFKGLLLGLFFMAVGASINFDLIAERPGTIVSLVVALMVVKGLLLFVIGRSFRLSTDQNFLFSFGLAQTGEFAFVLLSLIRGEGILDGETVGMLLVVVALSMLLTPLVMLFNQQVLQPRVGTLEQVADRPADPITERRRVIIAGFGQFGAVAGRFLGANGIRATILDNDSDRVELLRRMGFEVYYGDASRFDLLETAGAGEAEVLMIGSSVPEQNLAIVHAAQKHFPDLQLVVRALNYDDTYELMDAGVAYIHRDVLRNGLDAAKRTLRLLGFRAYQLERNAKRFLDHDAAMLHALAAARGDSDRYADAVRGAVQDMETVMQTDLASGSYGSSAGWDAESLVAEFGEVVRRT